MMKNRILIGLAISLLMIGLPAFMVTTGRVQDAALDMLDEEGAIAKDDGEELTVERIEGDEAQQLRGIFEIPDRRSSAIGRSIVDSARTRERFDLGTGNDLPDQELFVPRSMMLEDMEPTRASDKENNDDLGNGSKLSVPETVSGQLFIDSAPVNPQSDIIDWYKLEIPSNAIDPKAGSTNMHNYTITLTEFTSSDIDLSEPYHDGTQWLVDYVDTIEVYLIYSHYSWTGFTDMGGRVMLYDDLDDTDGWSYRDNWTFSFRPVIDSQGTAEDTNGFTGGLTERGWYYIAIRYLYLTASQTATPRTDNYYIDYTFTIERTSNSEINNYPFTSSHPNGAGNDWKNATTTQPSAAGSARSDSNWNNQDWYRIKGDDRSYLWDIDIQFRLDWIDADGFHLAFWEDDWLSVYMVYYSWGEDRIWGTEDDGWRSTGGTFTIYITTGDGFINIGDYTGLTFDRPTNWTNAPATVDGGLDPRDVYMLVFTESVNLVVQNNQLVGISLGTTQWMNDYRITWTIQEIPPNNPPSIDKIEVFTKNPANVNLFSNVGGYYGTDFTIEVTYSDEDNDPPKNVWLLIDPFTAYEKKIDIVNSPKNPFATNFVEGVVYKYDVKGDLLKEGNHVILAYAMDTVPSASIKTAYLSLNLWLNDTLIVWDDDPVMKNQNFVGAPTILEDSLPVGIPLETVNGVFIDPEGMFEGFQIWNETLGDWTDTLDLEEMTLKIEEFSGYGSVVVYPKENRHGSATIKVMGYDLYSFQNHSFKITITEVNDPPMVYHILIGDEEYEVDNTNPLNPFAVLDSVTVLEDEEFEFQIIAEDTDHEPDRTPLRYEYIRSFSGDWDEDPTVGFDSGIVTFTPTNADSQKGLLAMVFNVRDGRDNGEIRLTVSFKVTNVNDPPTITLPPSISPFYLQDQRVQFRVTGSDIDKGDVLTFSVNIEVKVGDVDPVMDQLHPDADIKEGRDWGMDANTGDFWFIASDQNIWKNADGTMAKTKEIEFEFAVTDKAGAKATAKRTLIFNDVNSPPEAPKEIYHQIKDEDPDTPGDQGLTVMFWVDPVFDIEMDTIQYRWTFSDGGSMTGIRINYTFATEGQKTVQIYAFDGTDESESISKVITVTKPKVDPIDDDKKPPVGPGTGGSEGNSLLIIIIIVVVVLFLLIIAVLLFFVLRKKPAPPAQIYGYDQQQLAAYQMQGLPPAQLGALPPGENLELPPAPAEGDQQLGYAEGELQPEMYTPQAQTEMTQAEQPQGMLCPSCSSPVDPTWFLCPNCKAPLQ